MPIRSNRKVETYFDFFSRSTGPVEVGDDSGGGGSPSGPGAYFGTRGFHAGGNNTPSATNIIGYYAFATTSNASDFGDLSYARIGTDGASNETRIVWGPGRNNNPTGYYGGPSTEYDYITCATTGNATTFGETANGNGRGYVAATSATTGRGCHAAGNEGPGDKIILS